MTPRDRNFFGAMIDKILDAKNLTLVEVHHRGGIDKGHLSRLRSGQRPPPRGETLKKLAQGLEFPLDLLKLVIKNQNNTEAAKQKIWGLVQEELRLNAPILTALVRKGDICAGTTLDGNKITGRVIIFIIPKDQKKPVPVAYIAHITEKLPTN